MQERIGPNLHAFTKIDLPILPNALPRISIDECISAIHKLVADDLLADLRGCYHLCRNYIGISNQWCRIFFLFHNCRD